MTQRQRGHQTQCRHSFEIHGSFSRYPEEFMCSRRHGEMAAGLLRSPNKRVKKACHAGNAGGRTPEVLDRFYRDRLGTTRLVMSRASDLAARRMRGAIAF